MNRLLFLATILLTLATTAQATTAAVARSQTPPAVGQQAPNFTLRDHTGRRVSLAEGAGTKVVLVFYRGYW